MKYNEVYKAAIYPLTPELFSSKFIRNNLESSFKTLKNFNAGIVADEGFVESMLMVGSLVDNNFHRKSSLNLKEAELLDEWNEALGSEPEKWMDFMKRDVRASLEQMIKNWENEVAALIDESQGIQVQLWDVKSEQIVNVDSDLISIENGYKSILSSADYMISMSIRTALIGYEGIARYFEEEFSSLLDMLDGVDQRFKLITEACGDEIVHATGFINLENAYFWLARKPKSSVIIQI